MADKCPHWDFRLFQFAINPDTYRKNNSQFIAPPGALPCAMAPRCMRRTEQLRQRRGKPETSVLQAQLETSHSSHPSSHLRTHRQSQSQTHRWLEWSQSSRRTNE
ncbi:hypothetical protein DPMN_015177 [Dreissena polymorpha]|uniref:Uncharacterized protein n=1 Tax=Dreissena polymorpha TaxID=45954 RepID=A0A9D4S5C5_DREPO|nr:hypothetical protein DPMN_015177 [Dreissena polymorpha]